MADPHASGFLSSRRRCYCHGLKTTLTGSRVLLLFPAYIYIYIYKDMYLYTCVTANQLKEKTISCPGVFV